MASVVDPDKYKDNIEKDLKAWKDLVKVKDSDELESFMKVLVEAAASNMIQAFTSSDVNSWEDFVEIRGQVKSYLLPIQQVYSAQSMYDHLKQQLDDYYREQ